MQEADPMDLEDPTTTGELPLDSETDPDTRSSSDVEHGNLQLKERIWKQSIHGPNYDTRVDNDGFIINKIITTEYIEPSSSSGPSSNEDNTVDYDNLGLQRSEMRSPV